MPTEENTDVNTDVNTEANSVAEPLPASDSLSKSEQYVVIARRYRPQTFDELIGQGHVARAMTGAIETNRVGHAYLFTGARGVGKTSAARILSKALNCLQGPTPTPCNECEICKSVNSGSDVDVLEIDGASNRGVDEIRQLRQNVAVRPSRARYKIYIIDEVHMLTREAFNALLKTLEEPPKHVKFIFCTTEAEKIPITIRSRCQRFDFAGIQAASIVDRLRQICQIENVTAEDEALEVLARRAAGSMRDSQSLLEQVLSCSGEQLTAAGVHTMLGTAGGPRLDRLIDHLAQRNAAGAIAELDGAVEEGVDIGQLLDQLLGYFRDCMVAAVGCDADAFLFASSGQIAQVRTSAEQMGLATVLAAIQILDQALARLRMSTHARILAEMAIVRICHLDDLDELPNLIAQLSGTVPTAPAKARPARPLRPAQETGPPAEARPAQKKSDSPLNSPPNKPVPPQEPPTKEPPAKIDSPQSTASEPPTPEPDISPSEASIASQPVSVIDLTDESIKPLWSQALENITDMVADQASRCSGIAISGPNRLAVSFSPKYNSIKKACERPEKARILEAELSKLAGCGIRLRICHFRGRIRGPTAERAGPANVDSGKAKRNVKTPHGSKSVGIVPRNHRAS